MKIIKSWPISVSFQHSNKETRWKFSSLLLWGKFSYWTFMCLQSSLFNSYYWIYNIRRSYLQFYSARVGLCLARDVRETFVDICLDSSGNQCCADDGQGMGTAASRHTYWINRGQGGETREEIFSSVDFLNISGSWNDMDLACKTEKPGASR